MSEAAGEGESFADAFAGLIRISKEPESPSTVAQTSHAGVLPVDIGLSGVLLRVVNGRALLEMMESFGEVAQTQRASTHGVVRLKKKPQALRGLCQAETTFPCLARLMMLGTRRVKYPESPQDLEHQ